MLLSLHLFSCAYMCILFRDICVFWIKSIICLLEVESFSYVFRLIFLWFLVSMAKKISIVVRIRLVAAASVAPYWDIMMVIWDQVLMGCQFSVIAVARDTSWFSMLGGVSS